MVLPGRHVVTTAVLALAACDDATPEPPQVCPVSAESTARQTTGTTRDLQCGPTLDLVPINSYRGELAGVQDLEDAVVLINGTCTGTLIAAAAGAVVLTAGHCVGLGDRSTVAFNHEDAPDGEQLITEATVIERASAPDYALLVLDELPAIAPAQLTARPTDLLAIIQHPRGMPKVIAEGALLDQCDGLVHYVDLDTLIGSSGAGVVTRGGHLYGVHTDGDCGTDGSGANRGWTAMAIVEASAHLVTDDLGER